MRKNFASLLAAVVLAIPVVAEASFSNLYVFGDSLSDNGNLYQWTASPNPVTGGIPIPLTSYGPLAPLYSPGRFTDGPSYSELLWSSLQASGHLAAAGDLTPRGLKPWGPPEVDTAPPAGTNYAVGGARSRYHAFDVDGLPPVGLAPGGPGSALFYPFSLRGQFDQFLADTGGKKADPKALFVVWSGSNDVGDVLKLAATGNPAAALGRMNEALQDIAFVLGGLVASGVDQLLVPNVPDLGLVPQTNSNPAASAAATFFSRLYDNALDLILDGLSSSHPELNLFRFDSFGFLHEVNDSPSTFGFSNVVDACLLGIFVGPPDPGSDVSLCSNPDEYLFWDLIHPSARAHAFLAERMAVAVPEPATGLLLLTLPLFTILRARVRG